MFTSTSSSDCRAGLACVGTVGVGQCLPYCCDTITPCSRGTFCAPRPLLEKGRHAPLEVPVCAPAGGCRLDEPAGCQGPTCSCPVDQACTVVGSDGTTACVTPGTGHAGDPCPCAAGYFCAKGQSACVKICKTDGTDGACAPGKCQIAPGFPDRFGLCIGPVPTAQ